MITRTTFRIYVPYENFKTFHMVPDHRTLGKACRGAAFFFVDLFGRMDYKTTWCDKGDVGWVELTVSIRSLEVRRRSEFITSECDFLVSTAPNRDIFRDGLTLLFVHILSVGFVKHGTSCPVRRVIWYTRGHTPSRGETPRNVPCNTRYD